MGFFQPPSLPFQEKPRLVTDEDLGAFREQMGASLLAIRGLQELDLSACSRITDSSITQVRDEEERPRQSGQEIIPLLFLQLYPQGIY